MARNLGYVALTLLIGGVLCAVINFAMPGPSASAPAASAVNVSADANPDGPATLSPLAAKLSTHLMALGSDGEPHGFDDAKLAGVKFFAFYYSASWCPPCRAFTPDLVSFYKDFKPAHPNFELIFVNDDQSDGDMIAYMKGDAMPWPAVWYAEINNPDLGAKRYCGSGIPDLVLVDADGRVLSDSFRNGQYVGPQRVVDDIREMVR